MSAPAKANTRPLSCADTSIDLSDCRIDTFFSFEKFKASLPKTYAQVPPKARWSGPLTSYDEARNRLINLPEPPQVIAHTVNAPLTQAPSIALDRVGFSPCVPAAIAGMPEAMFSQCAETMGLGPVRVFVGVNSRATFSSDRLAQRGAETLKIVYGLAVTRPLELVLYCDHYGPQVGGAILTCFPVNIHDRAKIGFALTDPCFLRRLCFARSGMFGFDGAYGWCDQIDSDEHLKKLRKRFKLTEQDILIPGGVNPPIQFVPEMSLNR